MNDKRNKSEIESSRLAEAAAQRLAAGTASDGELQAWCAELSRLTPVAGSPRTEGAGEKLAEVASHEMLADSAELRAGWDRLCQSLTQLDANWDERPFLASLEREERAARHRIVWSLALSLSLAGMVIGAFVWLDARSQATVGQLVASGSLRPRELGRETAVAGSPTTNGAASSAAAQAAFGWDDGLDEQLNEVEESLVVLQSQWRGGASDGERLLERLESMRSEWEAETL